MKRRLRVWLWQEPWLAALEDEINDFALNVQDNGGSIKHVTIRSSVDSAGQDNHIATVIYVMPVADAPAAAEE